MSKKLIIGIAAGVAAIGGAIAFINKRRKEKSDDGDDVVISDDDFDEDDDFWDDDLDEDELYEYADPELRDSKQIIDAITQLTEVVENIIDRKHEELYGI